MKIVQVTHHFSPCIGGVESVVLETSRRLVEAGHEVSVVCLDRCAKGGKILPGTGEIDGIKITRIPFIDLKYYKIAPRVLSLITGADLVHVHGVGFFSDYLLALKGVHKLPVIVSTHGGIMHTRKMRAIKAIYGLWMPLMLNRADAVVAVSKNDRDAFSRICAGGKVRLIENGIDYARFANARGKTEKNSFIYVGRLSRNKRVDNLIETFAFLKKAGVEFKLTILGHDFDGIAEKLHGLVEKKGLGGDVMFVGSAEAEELAKAVARAEYFVSASEYEGFGLSTVEAMAAGTVPLVNNIPAFRQLIHNRRNGFLLDYGKPELAARVIQEVIGMPAVERVRIAGRAKSRAKSFDWERKVREFEGLYSQVVQRLKCKK